MEEKKKIYRIVLVDGTAIETENYDFSWGYPRMITVYKKDVVDDHWQLFDKETEFIHFSEYAILYIKVKELEKKQEVKG